MSKFWYADYSKIFSRNDPITLGEVDLNRVNKSDSISKNWIQQPSISEKAKLDLKVENISNIGKFLKNKN